MSKQMAAPSRAKPKPETREEWIARHAAKLAARRAELAALGLTAHDLAPAAWAAVDPVAELDPIVPVAKLEETMRIEPEPMPAILPHKLTRVVETPRFSHKGGTLEIARAHLQTAGPLTIPALAQLLGRDEQFTRTVTLRLVRRGLAVQLPDKVPSATTGRLLLVFAATEEDPYVPMSMTPAAAQRAKARP